MVPEKNDWVVFILLFLIVWLSYLYGDLVYFLKKIAKGILFGLFHAWFVKWSRKQLQARCILVTTKPCDFIRFSVYIFLPIITEKDGKNWDQIPPKNKFLRILYKTNFGFYLGFYIFLRSCHKAYISVIRGNCSDRIHLCVDWQGLGNDDELWIWYISLDR